MRVSVRVYLLSMYRYEWFTLLILTFWYYFIYIVLQKTSFPLSLKNYYFLTINYVHVCDIQYRGTHWFHFHYTHFLSISHLKWLLYIYNKGWKNFDKLLRINYSLNTLNISQIIKNKMTEIKSPRLLAKAMCNYKTWTGVSEVILVKPFVTERERHGYILKLGSCTSDYFFLWSWLFLLL